MDKEKYNQYSVTKNLIQTRLEGFTATEKAILVCLVSYMKKDKKSRLSCFVGQKTVADLVGTTRAKVIESLVKFEADGFISSEKRFDNSKVYTWVGITEKERSFNINKVKRTDEEWDNYFKNKCQLEALENEAGALQEKIATVKRQLFNKTIEIETETTQNGFNLATSAINELV